MAPVPPLPPGIVAPPPRPPLPVWRVSLRLFGTAAALAFFGIIPFMGLPGALWIGVGAPVAMLFTDRLLPTDSAWPMAIIVTLLWPWALPLAYLTAAATLPRRARWTATLIATALCATAIAAGFQITSGVLGDGPRPLTTVPAGEAT